MKSVPVTSRSSVRAGRSAVSCAKSVAKTFWAQLALDQTTTRSFDDRWKTLAKEVCADSIFVRIT
jgi:hypothetical protein